MTEPDTLAALLARTEAILLDFDGPMCSVFAGYPAADVADDLRKRARAAGEIVPEYVELDPDPLGVLAWSATVDRPHITRLVEDALLDAELAAVASASPTPHVVELIHATHARGIHLAVVSNNSAHAVSTYLRNHDLDWLVSTVAGRAYAEPERMKPHPDSLTRAIGALNTRPAAALMIGDSPSDIMAAVAVGALSIGYANKIGKTELLSSTGANAVVESLNKITAALHT